MSKTAVVQLVSELENLGYVERRIDPTDGRAKTIHYTPKGLGLLTDAMEIAEEINAELKSALGERGFAELSTRIAQVAHIRHGD
ncbi:MAG: MarR family winged helix-turn-helix transcriptional regulator [Mycobacterium sp.]